MTLTLRHTAQGVLLLVVALLLGASFAPALALAQEEPAPARVTVTLTADQPTPEFIEVPVGSVVVFVNDDSVPHQVTATVEEGKSTAWEYNSGVLPAKDGETRATSEPTPAFEATGRYTFNDAQGLVLPENVGDEINVLAPQPAPEQTAPADGGTGASQPSDGPSGPPSGEPGTSSPGPSGSPAPGQQQQGGASPGPPAGAAPGSPAPTGGTGTTGPLPLDGGFGSFGSTPVPIPGLDPLAPAIAPPLDLVAAPPALLPDVAPAPTPTTATRAPGVAALPTGSLPGIATDRAYGLPAVLSAVSIVGVVSLLVRVLLAEPVARVGTAASRSGTVTA